MNIKSDTTDLLFPDLNAAMDAIGNNDDGSMASLQAIVERIERDYEHGTDALRCVAYDAVVGLVSNDEDGEPESFTNMSSDSLLGYLIGWHLSSAAFVGPPWHVSPLSDIENAVRKDVGLPALTN